MRGRIQRVLGAATLLVALFAGVVSAGGWATITADPGNGRPTEGQPITIGFTVLQHGVTPAGWVTPRLVAVRDGSGERVVADATGQGADGHFVATLTLPTAGDWTWQVELQELQVEMTPVALAVATVDGAAPASGGAAGGEALAAELNRLRGTVTALQADVARLAAVEPSGLPLVASIAIAALAGAVAGFAMVALGRGSSGAARGAADERAPAGAGIRPAG